MEIAVSIVIVGVLVFLAHLFASIFGRTRIPDVLLLMIMGLILGPIGKLSTPQHLGAVGPVFTTVTLVIILFEAGLSLDFDVLRSSLHRAFRLATVSFLLTMVSVAIAGIFLLRLNPTLACMLGAILASTSPAIIVPLSRRLDMKDRTRAILVVESAISDVLSIVVALALLQAYRLGNLQVGRMAGQIVSTLALAAILGILSGFAWSAVLARARSLENSAFITPAFVFILFGCVELLGYSGYIAALAFGATLGNIESFHRYPGLKRFLPGEPITMNEPERVFLAEVVFLLKTFFFVYVGLSVDLANPEVIWIGCALTAIIFATRIPAVFFSLEKTTPRRDMSFLAAMAPKGLAAIVLASIPVQNQIPAGEPIRAVVNVVVFASITLTSTLAFLIERTPVGSLFHRLFSKYGQTPVIQPAKDPVFAADWRD